MIRCYSDLIKMDSFEDRFNYLALHGRVGQDTFGYERYLNQMVYHNHKWKALRDQIIIRDNGCDLGLEGYDIYDKIYIHHMNPITAGDIVNNSEFMWNPEFLICVSFSTHNAIHYGDESYLTRNQVIERKAGDTRLW